MNNEWIFVADRLPQEEEMVLVYGRFGIDIACLSNNEWFDNSLYSVEEVSYWMPLPPIP